MEAIVAHPSQSRSSSEDPIQAKRSALDRELDNLLLLRSGLSVEAVSGLAKRKDRYVLYRSHYIMLRRRNLPDSL